MAEKRAAEESSAKDGKRQAISGIHPLAHEYTLYSDHYLNVNATNYRGSYIESSSKRLVAGLLRNPSNNADVAVIRGFMPDSGHRTITFKPTDNSCTIIGGKQKVYWVGNTLSISTVVGDFRVITTHTTDGMVNITYQRMTTDTVGDAVWTTHMSETTSISGAKSTPSTLK